MNRWIIWSIYQLFFPLAFWKSHAGTFPHVAQQDEKLLCVTATSLPCERLFSVAGILLEKKRTALTPEHVREMLSLNSWLKWMLNNNHDFKKLIVNAACVIYVLYYFFVFTQYYISFWILVFYPPSSCTLEFSIQTTAATITHHCYWFYSSTCPVLASVSL